MIYQILITLFALLGCIIILLILIQKGKSSMGLGGLGGGTQLLFGGSGGQDLFQKATWALGAIFMASSLILAMIKRPSSSELLGSLAKSQPAPVVMPKVASDVPVTGAPVTAASEATETAPAAEPTTEGSTTRGSSQQAGA